jgi:hypothetical protein
MNHPLFALPLVAAALLGCDSKPDTKFEPVDSVPHTPAAEPQIQRYSERIRNEILAVQGSPVDRPASGTSSALADAYQADLWLANTDMSSGLSKRMIQNVVITARLYKELLASADNGKLARDVLEPLFSSSVHGPHIRAHLAQAMDASSLRLANEGAKSSIMRRFILEHATSFGDVVGFESFLKKPPELSRWRNDAVASVAYATSFPTIEQSALSVLPKILAGAGRTLSADDFALLDRRAGALSFSRVAYALRRFSDLEVYQLQQLLANEPQTRKAFEQTAVALFQSLTGGSSQRSTPSESAAYSFPVAPPTSAVSSFPAQASRSLAPN